MVTEREQPIRVAVFSHDGNIIDKARVRLDALERGARRRYTLEYDPQRGSYVTSGVPPGLYVLHAEADGVDSDRREVQVDPAGLEATVILGLPGMPFPYRGGAKVPFQPNPSLIALTVDPQSATAAVRRVRQIARESRLDPIRLGQQIRAQNVLAFQLRHEPGETELQRLHQELRDVDGVIVVGAVVRIDDASLSFLTGELIVRFKSHVTIEQLPEMEKRFGITRLRRLPQAGNAFLYRLPAATYDTLEIADRLVKSGVVEYAEPNLVSTVVDDTLNPSDFLYPMQWHLPLIHAPDAWQAIHDNIAGFLHVLSG
jgi:hypothetical protein